MEIHVATLITWPTKLRVNVERELNQEMFVVFEHQIAFPPRTCSLEIPSVNCRNGLADEKRFWQLYFIDKCAKLNHRRKIEAFTHSNKLEDMIWMTLTSLVSSPGWRRDHRLHHRSRLRPPNSSTTSPALKDETFFPTSLICFTFLASSFQRTPKLSVVIISSSLVAVVRKNFTIKIITVETDNGSVYGSISTRAHIWINVTFTLNWVSSTENSQT